LEEKKRA
jgi:hypothetical protein